MDTRLGAALELVAAGYRVELLPAGRKAPPRLGWSTAPPLTAEELRAAWRPGANVALRAGAMTDGRSFAVLDVDRHAGGPDGEKTLAASPELRALARRAYAEVRTPAGRHLYVGTPAGVRKGTAGPGVDILGAGAYVVAPPSIVAADMYVLLSGSLTAGGAR